MENTKVTPIPLLDWFISDLRYTHSFFQIESGWHSGVEYWRQLSPIYLPDQKMLILNQSMQSDYRN